MAVAGSYLATQIRGWLLRPVLFFRQYIFDDILPGLSNLGQKAERMANDYYNHIGSQPVGECGDVDMANVADDADAISQGWYAMMAQVRQTMLNLLAAGVFHLAEQQLAQLCRDAACDEAPSPETNLEKLEAWYQKYLDLDLKKLPSWATVAELRLVANTVKHGEGRSASRLKILYPAIFSNPDYAELYEQEGLTPGMREAHAPLTGEDLFVTQALLGTYLDGVESLFEEIAEYLESAEGYFPRLE